MSTSDDVLASGLCGLGTSPVTLKHTFLALSLPRRGVTDHALKGIGRYPDLQDVNLAGNSLTDDSSLSFLPQLRRVDLSDNKLTRALFFEAEPPEDNADDTDFAVTVGSALQEARLANNCIERIRDLSAHRFLRVLDLDGNAITEITGLSSLPDLRVLSLARNALTELDGLQGLKLTTLNVSDNRITSIAKVGQVPLLEELNVAGNELSSLAGVDMLTQLARFNASRNRITSMSAMEHLQPLARVASLWLRGNPVCRDAGGEGGDGFVVVTDDVQAAVDAARAAAAAGSSEGKGSDEVGEYDYSDGDVDAVTVAKFRLRVLFRLPQLNFLDDIAVLPDEVTRAANLHGADLSKRAEVFARHLPGELFENHLPPFVEKVEDDVGMAAAAAADVEPDDYEEHAAKTVATDFVGGLLQTGVETESKRRVVSKHSSAYTEKLIVNSVAHIGDVMNMRLV